MFMQLIYVCLCMLVLLCLCLCTRFTHPCLGTSTPQYPEQSLSSPPVHLGPGGKGNQQRGGVGLGEELSTRHLEQSGPFSPRQGPLAPPNVLNMLPSLFPIDLDPPVTVALQTDWSQRLA